MFQKIPFELQKKIDSELKPDEIAIWTDQPNPSKFMLSGFALWLFFIPWTAFALFWTAGAAGFQLPNLSRGLFNLFPLFGLPFILIGLGGLSSPFWLRMLAARTVYVITNHRVFTISGIRKTSFKSYYPHQITFIERKENKDGSGDLIFSKESYRDSDGDKQTKEDGFYSIRDVKMVESYLENLIESNKIGSGREVDSQNFRLNSIYD